MALKSIGIIVALCATLTIAIDGEVQFPPQDEYDYGPKYIYHRSPIESTNDKDVVFKEHYGFPKPYLPHNSEESGQWSHHNFPKSHFPHGSEESVGWGNHGIHKPYYPHNSEESGGWGHHGAHKPYYPHNSEELGEWGHHGFPKPYSPHSSETGKPYFPHNGGGFGEHHGILSPRYPDDTNKLGESNYYGLLMPHNSRSIKESEDSGERGQHGFSKPHFPQSSESGKYMHHGNPKPHFQHNSEGGEHHGFLNPHIPHGQVHGSEGSNHNGLHKPHFLHSSEGSGKHHGVHKPHFSRDSQESGEHVGLPMLHFSHNSDEQKSEHKIHRPDWYNPLPYNPQQSMQLNERVEVMDRRRPLFYPIYPYHPFHPHGHPSTNDEEFETIETLKRMNNNFPLENDNHRERIEEKYEGPYYHRFHNPHFPMNSDSSENTAQIRNGPFHHGFPHPHFKPFHKEPARPEENDIVPFIFEDPYINGDDDFPTSNEAQPYGQLSPPESNKGFQGPFFIIANEEGDFKLPNIILQILEKFHHGHGKPHHHHHGDNKPNEVENEVEEFDGSGEEDIIPLFAEANIPLLQDDDITENLN